jgi:hypothetical protein
MKKVTHLILSLLLSQLAFAQIKVTNLDKNTIPKTIKYKGHIVNAASYRDADGEHLVITTETGVVNTPNPPDGSGYRDGALYAYHYKINGNNYVLTWQMYDFVATCPVDVTAAYIPNTFAITDANKNGKAEVWLMYITACRGDVSPANMKIIMHEGDKKYAVRGESRNKVTDTQYEGGKYVFDEAFKTAPESFRQYAQSLWKKNILEKWN